MKVLDVHNFIVSSPESYGNIIIVICIFGTWSRVESLDKLI